jgi:hypothetical protein
MKTFAHSDSSLTNSLIGALLLQNPALEIPQDKKSGAFGFSL